MIKFIDFNKIHSGYKEKLNQAFSSFLDSSYYVLGEQVSLFEKSYANHLGVNHVIGVASGLDAISLSLRAVGVKKGDEVIVPSNTYIATVIALSQLDATPVFVEPSINTYNIDPKKIESAITSRTKAIIPVHLYGLACDMSTIMDIANKKNIHVIEDNAQGHGAKHNGQLTGSFGTINATSFYPSKNLGALGDAGAISTNDSSLADKCRMYRNYGTKERYITEVIGVNSRLDELQAALLNVKLSYLKEQNKYRRNVAHRYIDELRNIDRIILPKKDNNNEHVYHQFVIKTNERDELQEFLKQKGIPSIVHYPIPPHLQKAYHFLGYKEGDFPVAEEIANTVLSIPCYPNMPIEDIEKVISSIKEFY